MTGVGEAYIVDACRTPIGRYRGALSALRPDDLAAAVIGALVERAGLAADDVDEVVLGAANQAGEDNRNVARMAALLAGLGPATPGVTVNRLCASGLEAVNQAAAMVALGHADLVVAGGVESMSRAPFVLPRSDERLPRRQELVDTTLGWRLVNPSMPADHTIALGATAEVLAREYRISREEQDEFAAASHGKAVAAQGAGAFRAEIVAVNVDGVDVTTDEQPRGDTSVETLASLRPLFAVDGTVTAGNASPLNDGAAAVLVASSVGMDRLGVEPLARIASWAAVGVEPRRMGIGPAPATRVALDRVGWKLDDLAIIELNEAFAAQALAVIAELGVDRVVVNPRGGALALGHPLGCSGARIVTTLVHQLAERPAGARAAATMCVGVGQGVTTLVERP